MPRQFKRLDDGSLIESKRPKYKPDLIEGDKKKKSYLKIFLWIFGIYFFLIYWVICLIGKLCISMLTRKGF